MLCTFVDLAHSFSVRRMGGRLEVFMHCAKNCINILFVTVLDSLN